MTEEIIIDGVNVAGCKYCDVIRYTYPTEGLNIECYADYQNEMVDNCKGKTTCYYKQLKRLEQENKTNLKQMELDVEHICRLNKQIERLEQENKELKEKLDKEEYNACCECTNIQNQNDNYRSALEEIRNDLKEVCKEECDYTKPKFCGDCDCRYGQILNKINEVLQ